MILGIRRVTRDEFVKKIAPNIAQPIFVKINTYSMLRKK
jgi:hypothetical protein